MGYTDYYPKDLDTTKPTEGATPPSEVNDAERQDRSVLIKGEYYITTLVNTDSPATLTSASAIVLCNAASGTITVNLPAVATCSSTTVAKRYRIIKIDSSTNAITITPDGSETIEGNATYTLENQWDGVTLLAKSGAQWYIEGKVEKAKSTVVVKVLDDDTPVTTGDGKAYFTVPAALNGMNMVDCDACVYTVSSSGTPTVQIHNLTDTQDMLSTRITIDENEYTSYTAAAAAAINASYDDVATGDILRFDIDVAGTDAKGLELHLVFQKP